MILFICSLIAGFVLLIIAGTLQDMYKSEKKKRVEAERKLKQVIREREEEMLYDLRTRDQDNIPDDQEWIDRRDDMPPYRNIPSEWRNR